MEQFIRPIFQHHKLPTVKTISPLSGGMVNPGYYVNDAFVIRFNHRDPHLAKYRRETIAYRHLNGVVPTPNLIVLDESRTLAPTDVIILERVAGVNLDDAWATLSTSQREARTFDAGALLAQINAVQVEGKFGRLENATFDSWPAFLQSELTMNLAEIAELGLLDGVIIGRIHTRFDQMRSDLATVTTPFLIHGDYGRGNINYANGQLNSVYDFEWATAGDPLFDFRNSDRSEADDFLTQDVFLDGYTSIGRFPPNAEQRIDLYRTLYCLELLLVAHHNWGQEAVNWICGRIKNLV
ncbi:MAG: phosphotransferase family protein [Candidatus Promineifilaceae bacterium]